MEADEYIYSSESAASRSAACKNNRRRATDCDFKYSCEWSDCTHVSPSMNEFNHHMSQHRRGYTMSLGTDEEIRSGEFRFFCQWQDCNAQIEGQLDDFSRHVFYHTFHQYLKFLGLHIQLVEKLERCHLDTASRNVVPELPEKLMCRWEDCRLTYDNPYIFYAHVSHHCEEYPKVKDSKAIVMCKWEGCPVITKNSYKMKEHVRSHTQAKVVACPTCGSLFASNTRYIDHLKRQSRSTDLNFECSHCNGRFGTERILREHMRHHVNHYKCPLCDMTCHSPSAVRDHVRYRHSEERSFQCPKCDYRAKTATDLQRHIPKHNQKGEYPCAKPGCDNVIRTKKQQLEYYCSKHEITKQYECHICHMSCVRSFLMTNHLKEVHNYRWPSGHKRFRYKRHEDGVFRLQIIRYESIEVTQQILGQNLSPGPASLQAVNSESCRKNELSFQGVDTCDRSKLSMEEDGQEVTTPDNVRHVTAAVSVKFNKEEIPPSDSGGHTEIKSSSTKHGDMENIRMEVDNLSSEVDTVSPSKNENNICNEKKTKRCKQNVSNKQRSQVKSTGHKKRLLKASESSPVSGLDNTNVSEEGTDKPKGKGRRKVEDNQKSEPSPKKKKTI